jgi:GGDEF domain-containing protein
MMRLLPWLIPGGLILGATLALVLGVGPDGFLEHLAARFPWVVLTAAVLLASYFHRSRVVIFSLALLGLHIVVSRGYGGSGGFFAVGGLAVILFGVLVFFQDRGVLSTSGLVQLAAFLVVSALGVLLLTVVPEDLEVILGFRPIPDEYTLWTGVPQPVLVALLMSLTASALVAVLRKGPVERGVVWSLLMMGLAMHLSAESGTSETFLMSAGLILGLSVVETSYALVYMDDLTGLPARRALMRDLHGIGGTYSAAMVDVDHFKRFNDRYGHDVGDQVLRMVATRLAKTPGGARAYRYGGEEFTLLFPGKSVQEALPHAKEIRRSVEEAVFSLRSWRRPRNKPVDPGAWRGAGKQKPKRLSVTVSIGVADSSGADVTPEQVLKKADRALYRAKKAGRNRVAQ